MERKRECSLSLWTKSRRKHTRSKLGSKSYLVNDVGWRFWLIKIQAAILSLYDWFRKQQRYLCINEPHQLFQKLSKWKIIKWLPWQWSLKCWFTWSTYHHCSSYNKVCRFWKRREKCQSNWSVKINKKCE
jgi:hypothetical protein